MGLNILQLSDIHLCSNDAPTPAMLLLGGEYPNGAPDAILITGDLFDCNAFKGKKANEIKRNIKKGADFCRELISEINTHYHSNLNELSMFFVPGNHEIKRSAKNKTEFLSVYRKFLEEFYETIPDWYLEDLSYVKTFEEQKVILVGLVSPCFDSKNVNKKSDDNGSKYDDYGLITPEQLLGINNKLRDIHGRDEYSIVVSLHHQFILMEERDKSYVDESYLRNSEQFIRFLANENVCAVLHGHKHKDSNRRLNVELDITKPEKIITVLGCGSLAETDTENCFNYLTVYPAGYKCEIEYSSYKRTNAGYKLDTDSLRLPVVVNNKGLVILANAINDNPDLYNAYSELRSYDNITHPENVFKVLDNTVFSLDEVCNNIELLPDLLYFILAAAHYRVLINRKADKKIIKKVDDFIDSKISKYNLEDFLKDQLKNGDINSFSFLIQNDLDSLKREQKTIIVFSVMTALIIDFYLIIKYRCEEYFNNYVSKKIDFSYSGENLSTDLRGNTIEFSVDDDRRSLEISVICDSAEAVKICSLITKDFEMILHKFERVFSDYGFKIYYIQPKLKYNDRLTNEIESRQFGSYIPLLLPLLAGKNIYSTPEAFAREVIQNSIDAINVRREHDPDFNEEGEIRISLGKDVKKDLQYFEIKDNGSGMTKYILERYLTTLGLSYYSSSDYKSMGSQYNPISQYGIGFLSCFMLGKRIEIHTMHYKEQTGYYMDIPNYDGCFFIEKDASINNVGTTIRIWENPDQRNTLYAFDANKIKEYMHQNMRNLSINIFVDNQPEFPKNHLFEKIKEITKTFKIYHFIPLKKDEITKQWKACTDTSRTEGYGIYAFKPDDEIYSSFLKKSRIEILNNGILVPNLADIKEVASGANSNMDAFMVSDLYPFLKISDDYFYIIADLPSETLNLSVSRDDLKELTDYIDLSTVERDFKEIKSKSSYVNAPYFVMQKKYDEEKFNDQYLSFDFDSKEEIITIKADNKKRKNEVKSYLSFLNYLRGDEFYKKIAKKFPLTVTECGGIDSFTYDIVSTLYLIIESFQLACNSGFVVHNIINKYDIHYYDPEDYISVDAQAEEYDSAVLNSFFEEDDPLSKKCKKLANAIDSIKLRSRIPDEVKKGLSSLMEKENLYYGNIIHEMKSWATSFDIASYIADYLDDDSFQEEQLREIQGLSKRVSAVKEIERVINNESDREQYLSNLFYSYLKRAYASVRSSERINMIDIAGISVAAIKTLMVITSILIPVKELEKGIKIKINRNKIEPSEEWIKDALSRCLSTLF